MSPSIDPIAFAKTGYMPASLDEAMGGIFAIGRTT
jgi:hypothetical protein